MRTSSKLTAVLLGTLGVTVSAPAWASVERTVALSVASSGWSWNPPGAVPVPGSSVGTAGDLMVGYAGDPEGAPSAEAYLGLDLSELPAKSAVISLPVVLKVDAAAHNVQPADNALVACMTADDFTPGEATPAAQQPKDDCSVSATGLYDAAAGTYTFDVAAFVDAWKAAGSANLVIRPPVDYVVPDGAPFQVNFITASTAMSADLQLPDTVIDLPDEDDTATVTPPTSSGGSFGGFTSGPGLGSVSTTPAPSGPATAPAPQTAPAPTVAAPPAMALSVASAAEIRAALAEDNLPPSGFWLAGGLGAVVLTLVSWAVGDTRSQARVLRAGERRRAEARAALVARQREGSAGVSATSRRARQTAVRPAGRAGTAADLG